MASNNPYLRWTEHICNFLNSEIYSIHASINLFKYKTSDYVLSSLNV